jgi:hypothetical protein
VNSMDGGVSARRDWQPLNPKLAAVKTAFMKNALLIFAEGRTIPGC